MSVLKKVSIAVFLLVCIGFAGRPHPLRQTLRNWVPGVDTTGAHYVVYDIVSPCSAHIDFVDETDITSFMNYSLVTNMARWNVDLGNFPVHDWSGGDTVIAFGSWDSAYAASPSTYGDNVNHKGYYWLYSDTVIHDQGVTETWYPDDTLRPIPKPIVTKTGPSGGADDTVWIRIPNPRETSPSGSWRYDVLGYWIWADTTGTGTPNALDAATAIDVDFVAVQGDTGDTTVYWFLESEKFTGWHHWTTYFAYKIVARPDTTVGDNPDSPGYCTYYFSVNSDAIDIYQNVVGVNELTPTYKTRLLCAAPSPFRERTTISFSLSKDMPVTIKVYNATGQLVSMLADRVFTVGEHIVDFTGFDNNGAVLPAGVYMYRMQTPERTQTGRVVRL
jgi:hypothetical protein